MHEIRIDSLIFLKNAVIAESDTDLDAFWISLTPNLGYMEFTRQDPGQAQFLLHQVLPAHSPAPDPLVSVRGVLWSRRAAREADQSIATYQAGLGVIPGS